MKKWPDPVNIHNSGIVDLDDSDLSGIDPEPDKSFRMTEVGVLCTRTHVNQTGFVAKSKKLIVVIVYVSIEGVSADRTTKIRFWAFLRIFKKLCAIFSFTCLITTLLTPLTGDQKKKVGI